MHHQKIAELNSRALEWESPAESRKESDNSQDPFPGYSSMLHFDAKALAQQMTLIDAELFRAIRVCTLFLVILCLCATNPPLTFLGFLSSIFP